MIPLRKCDSCNKNLPLGSTKYNVRLEVTSDFDGFLPENDDFSDEESGALDALMNQIEKLDEDQLDQDVHVEVEMTLCVECKRKLMEQIESYTDGASAMTTRQRMNLH